MAHIWTDFLNILENVFLSGDLITVVAAIAIAVIAGFQLKGLGKLPYVAIGAIVIYGLFHVIRALIETATSGSEAPITSRMGNVIGNSWDSLMVMNVGTFIVYFIAFAAAITASHFAFMAMPHKN